MTKKVLLVIMDGVGISSSHIGDAVTQANTPTLDRLIRECPNTQIQAHGQAVGLPSDEDMGNSEVGHNALGCGQVYPQGALLVNQAIDSGRIYQSDTWSQIVSNCIKKKSTLHFIGLLSDGNVHSNIAHLISMIRQAKTEGIAKVRIHILLDGRDVPATSGLIYVDRLEKELKTQNDAGFNARIASGGGRMKITMDRYKADWEMVRRGWDIHVHGIGRSFSDATEAIKTYREENDVTDQNLPGFVIAEGGQPIGKIKDHDAVVLFNFRGDRAIEISMAFDNEAFEYFDRGMRPKTLFAGMLQYDGDLNLPSRYLVTPPAIRNTLSERLVAKGLRQYAISETQKYGHVTYFWNGNKSGKFDEALETYFEILSDRVYFDERPWMQSALITDQLIKVMKNGEYDFVRCNFPNGDMVGHTGNMDAAIIAVEAVDLALTRLLPVAKENEYTMVITADHGNCDEMLERGKDGNISPRTAHSLNPVPFIVADRSGSYKILKGTFGLANVASSIAVMLGVEPDPVWEPSILEVRGSK
jgi:2,3-bisphosphoglycerate-independent phosphoglycerate mutase